MIKATLNTSKLTVKVNARITPATPCIDGSAVLSNSVPTVISTTPIPSGDTVAINAPNATAVLKNTLGTILVTELIPSDVSEDITSPDATINDGDGDLLVSAPSGAISVITFEDFKVTDPTDIPNCIGWYRADLGITKPVANVTAWADQSGAGMADVIISGSSVGPVYEASYAPANGQPALYFDGVTAQDLSHTSSWDMAYVVVIATQERATPFGNYYGLLNAHNLGAILLANGAGGQNTLFWTTNSSLPTIVWEGEDLNSVAAQTVNPTGFYALRQNGAFPMTGIREGLRIGQLYTDAARRWEGRVFEVILFDAIPTDKERVLLSNYAIDRYGANFT